MERVLSEDIDAVIRAYDSNNFRLMNILANRVVSNSVFFSEVDFLPGFIYKDVALTFSRLKVQKSDTISTATTVCRPILEKIKESFFARERDKTPEDLWAIYLEYNLRIRDFVMNEEEKAVYSINYDFTANSYNWLIKYLEENKLLLKNKKNRLLDGILNEMDRILKCHSGKLREITIVCLIRALSYIYLYMLYVGTDEERNKIFPLLDRTLDTIKKDKIVYIDASKLLKDILIEWRKYYINYMDVIVGRETIQRGIVLPDEVKDKISESISKTLEEEIKEA